MMKRHLSIAAILFVAALLFVAGSALAVETEADWTTAETKHFVIHASERADVESIGQLAEAIYEGMALRYAYSDTEKTHLYIYTGRQAFLRGSPSADAAGYASPSRNLIAILQGAGNSTITLAHEINHIVFIRHTPRIETVPQWFVEGLALYESQPGVEAVELERYALARDIPEFIEREGKEDDAPATRREYADGYLKVNFIVHEFGRDKLYGVIARLKAGAAFDQALVESLGQSEDQLNAAWSEYARGERVGIWLVQLRDVGWYLMSILLVIVMIVFPIQRYRRLRAMDDEDDENDEGEETAY